MILKILQFGKLNEVGRCYVAAAETAKMLQVANLTAGGITIQASVDGQNYENCKFDDGSDMVFTPESESFIAELPAGNYLIQAVASDEVNIDVEIILA